MSAPSPAGPRRGSGATRTHLATAEGLLPAGHLLAGRYRILEPLGMGGMGVVYRALDEEIEVEVAVKILRSDLPGREEVVERFRRELVLARQVTHPHVVRIHDIGQDGDVRFLTMDYVPARSLEKVLADEGPIELDRAVHITRQLAEALDAAHARGVVHRDLKPANVLLDDAGEAYVTDFGVARSLGSSQLTVTGGVVGTPAYLSPEQARGDEVDGRSDLYALGILLFEMLSNSLPFPEGTPAEQMARRLTGRTRGLGEIGVEVPEWVERVLQRCLEPAPSRRYQRAADLAADLEAGPAGRLAGGGRSRRWWLASALAAAVVLPLGALVWWLAGRPGTAGGDTEEGGATGTRHALAVLPLTDETGRSDLAWVGTGLAELLADTLAESPDLRVVDPLRVLRTVADVNLATRSLTDAEAKQAAELLDADRLVLGKVRSLGEGLRVDLEVVAAEEPGRRTTLSAQEERLADLPHLVAELGTALRRQLAVAPPAENTAPATASASALRAYTEGLEALRRGDAVAAAPALEAAVEADPAFTAAWVRLAGAYEALGFYDRARQAAARAIAGVGPEDRRLALEARAREALLRGEPAAAQSFYERLTQRYPNDIEARIALAQAYGQQGNLGQAVTTLEKVVEQQRYHPRAWSLLGRYLIQSGESRRAVDEVLVHALVIQNRLANLRGKAEVLNAMGVAHQELGELAQASEHYAEAARLRSQTGDQRGYATSLKNLATVSLVRGDFASAEENLTTAIGILNEIGDHSGLAELEVAFGALEEERGRYEAALGHYRRSLTLRRDLGDELALADSYHNVGYAYYLLGDYENARVYWRQALDLYQEGGDQTGVVFARQSLGLLQLSRGEWDRALRSFVEALEASRRLGLKEAVAVSLGNLGRVAHYQGRYPAALSSYGEALEVLEELQDRRGLVEFTLFEAETLGALGMVEEMAGRLERAEELLAEQPNREQQADLYRLRGEEQLRRGETAAARRSFLRARQEAVAARGLIAELRARLGLGLEALAAGSPAAAQEELAGVATEASRVGHAVLELEAAEGLARAALARHRPEEAEAILGRALRRARDCGSYAGSFRLHGLLARSLAARGAEAEAAAERRRAAEALSRVESLLTPEQRAAFQRQPEVMEIAEQTASDPDLADAA